MSPQPDAAPAPCPACHHAISVHRLAPPYGCAVCGCLGFKVPLPIDTPEQDASARHDPVDHPSHYTSGGIECIDAIEAALTPEEFRGFCKGNALKYVWRERLKNGGEDLKKARWYIDRLNRQNSKEG